MLNLPATSSGLGHHSGYIFSRDKFNGPKHEVMLHYS